MSIVRIDDGFDIKITNDQELEQAMEFFINCINSKHDNEVELNALEDALNIYHGNYEIIDFY